MPAQTTAANTKYYGQNDTAPPLDDQLLDDDGNPLDLTGAEVYITIGWTKYSHYYSPQRAIVDRASCTIEGDPTLGNVRWSPQAGDLEHPGSFDISYEIKYADDTVRTNPLPTYQHIFVRTPPGGRREPLV